MKKVMLLALLGTIGNLNAQWEENGGIIFMKWGYQGGSTKVSNYFYETDASDYSNLTEAPDMIASRDVKYNNKAIFCEVEMIQPKMIFGMRFGWGMKKQVKDVPNFTSQDATYFNTFFGYGFHVKGKFSIIPTLRYNWALFFQKGSPESEVDLTPESVTSGYTNTRTYKTLGGNQRGLGLNFVLPVGEKILLRAGYYYEWIFREKKAYKGIAKTPEFEFYLPFDDDHTFGLALKVAIPRRKMFDNWSPDNPSVYEPETNWNSFIWEASLSIPLPSASTTTYVITVAD